MPAEIQDLGTADPATTVAASCFQLRKDFIAAGPPTRTGPEMPAEDWIGLGGPRGLEACESGRGFLQVYQVDHLPVNEA